MALEHCPAEIADYYRASGRDPLLSVVTRRLAPDLAEVERTLASGAPLPDEVCELDEFHLIVQAALSSLEPRHQACLVARYHEDLSLEEVGRVMSLSSSAANSLLHRARAQLRRAIKRLVGGESDFEELAK